MPLQTRFLLSVSPGQQPEEVQLSFHLGGGHFHPLDNPSSQWEVVIFPENIYTYNDELPRA